MLHKLPPDWQIQKRHTPLSEVIDWSHGYLHLTPEWYAVDCKKIRMAILDTGAPESHPDLEVAAVTDFTNSRAEWRDIQEHGTWCLGAIGAIANNVGVRGIAAGCQLGSAKVLDDSGSGTDETIIAGIEWADKTFDAHGISMSLGGSSMSTRVHAAMKAFLSRRPHRFIVCAAGNDGPKRPINYPAAWTDVCISVAALRKNGRLTSFSCWGPTVTCSAPGEDMLSTTPGGYGLMSGTSMATPIVAGIMAKIVAKHLEQGGNTPVDTIEQQKEHITRFATGNYREINPFGMTEAATVPVGQRQKLWARTFGKLSLELWREI